jgi:hypothetical protein
VRLAAVLALRNNDATAMPRTPGTSAGTTFITTLDGYATRQAGT